MSILSEKRLTYLLTTLFFVILILDARWIMEDFTGILNADWTIIFGIGIFSASAFLVLFIVRSKLLKDLSTKLKIHMNDEVDVMQTFKIESTKIVDGKYIVSRAKNGIKVFSVLRLTGRPKVPLNGASGSIKVDALDYISLFNKLQNLFSGLQKMKIPCLYIVSFSPIPKESKVLDRERKKLEFKVQEDRNSKKFDKYNYTNNEYRDEIDRFNLGNKIGFFQTDILFLVWVYGKIDELDFLFALLEDHTKNLLSSLYAVFPEMEVVRLEKLELLRTVGLFYPYDTDELTNVLSSHELAVFANFSVPTPTSSNALVEPIFELPKVDLISRDGPSLGWVRKGGKDLYPVYLGIEDLKTHVAIFGMTGSGKSTTAGAIVSRLVDLGLNTLIIDWHSEYRGLVISKGGFVFTPGRDLAPLTINPLDPSLSQDLSEHISLVTDIFSDVFSFTSPQSFMFREALNAAYEECKFEETKTPTLSSVIREIEGMPLRSTYDNETKTALYKRLKPLTEGQAGEALNGQSTISIEKLLENLVSIELGHFKEQNVRKIFTSILLKLVYDYRTERHDPRLKHVTLIEEARNIVPVKRVDDEPSIGEKMICELRKFGEGIIIVNQFPTSVSSEILKNAATRICHQMKTIDDIKILQGAMKLSEEQANFFHFLKPGEAIVNLPRLSQAFYGYIKPEGYKAASDVSNEEVRDYMSKKFYDNLVDIEVKDEITLSTLEDYVRLWQLLRKNKELTVKQIREQMGVSIEQFYKDLYPSLQRMLKDKLVEEIKNDDPSKITYRLKVLV